MPEEIEVPLEHVHEHIEEAHEELFGEEKPEEGKAGAEKAAEKKKHGWTRYIAVWTALLAVVAAIGALRGGFLVNEALLAKNDEISHRTQATDQWNYYQAKSIKGVVYATTAQLLPPGSPAVAKSRAEVARYDQQGAEIKEKAEQLEDQAKEDEEKAKRDMDRHHIFAFSVSLCQIAIALSAIAALTRSRGVWGFGLVAGLAGVLALVGGFLGVHLPFEY